MSLQQFFLVLRARYKLALLTLLGTVAVTLAVSLLLPARYTATTAVMVDTKTPDPIAGVILPAVVMPGYMATQMDIVNSYRVAQKVVRTLRLDQNLQAKEQWLEATNGRGTLELWLAELLQKKLDVEPSRESSIINIAYTGVDPSFAAAVANAFAQAYIDITIELKVEPAKQYAQWFGEQGKTLRNNLEKTQNRLSAYQQSKGIVTSDERLDNETFKLNELSTQLTIVQVRTADAQSKQKSGSALDTLPEVVQNSLIVSLKSEIARQEAKLQELAENLGKKHPRLLRQESEIASLKNTLETETQKIASGFSTSHAIGKNKEAELRAAI
ncbi:MAG: chain length determinant protein EpsF, partial [Nitrososphaera sp.]